MQHSIIHIHPLNPADRQLIDQEHARLEQFLHNLGDTCCELGSQKNCTNCARDKFASCQGRLTSFHYDFLDLVTEHFENEEKIMCDRLRMSNDEYFHKHRGAHAKLMRDLTEMMRVSSILNRRGNTAEAIRQICRWIEVNFAEHARTYDGVLLGKGRT